MSPELIEVLGIAGAGAGFVIVGMTIGRLLCRPHYVPVRSLNVQQGIANRANSPTAEPVESEPGEGE